MTAVSAPNADPGVAGPDASWALKSPDPRGQEPVRKPALGVVSRCTCHWVRAPRQLVVKVVTSVPIRPTCHSKLGFGAWTSSTSPARVYDYCPHVRLLPGGQGQLRGRPGSRGAGARADSRLAAGGGGEPAVPPPGRPVPGRRGRHRPVLDIGVGLPTQGAVHEVALEVNPEARVL